MKKLAIYAGIALSSAFFALNANAGTIGSCTGGSGDYGDAPTSYGVACHDTNNWQQLGDIGGSRSYRNDFNNDGWSAESSTQTNDSGDNGISWRTSSDGGNTWTDYSQSNELVQGQLVQFQVDVSRSIYGSHNYDQTKLWLDWYGTGSFNESDVVYDEVWNKDEASDGTATSNGSNSTQDFASFFSDILTVPLDSILGQVWMRARIICDFSLNNGNGRMLSSTGYYHQGETEDYQITIVEQVSAPATAILVSLFALGMMTRRKLS